MTDALPFPGHRTPRCTTPAPNTALNQPGTDHRAPGTALVAMRCRFRLYVPASLIRPLLTISLFFLSAACERADDRPVNQAQAPRSALSITTERRGNLQIVGADTISESARVLALFPEPDGAAIAFTFADSANSVSSALGLLDSGKESAQLIWPDSVANVDWPATHKLSWTASNSRGGVHAIVDVHNAELGHIEDEHPVRAATVRPGNPEATDAAARARATAYIDSLRLQPTGVPSQGTLRYTVAGLVHAPSDSLVAFYVIARSSEGSERMNPSWYALDLRTGRVAPVDSLTGRANALAETAAAWIGTDRFVYVKGLTLHEAVVRR